MTMQEYMQLELLTPLLAVSHMILRLTKSLYLLRTVFACMQVAPMAVAMKVSLRTRPSKKSEGESGVEVHY